MGFLWQGKPGSYFTLLEQKSSWIQCFLMNQSGTTGRGIGKCLWSFVKQNYLKRLEKSEDRGSLLGLTLVFFLSTLQTCVWMCTFPSDLRLSCQRYASLETGPSLRFTRPGTTFLLMGPLRKRYYRGPGTMFLVVASLVRCIRSAVLKDFLDGDQQQV